MHGERVNKQSEAIHGRPVSDDGLPVDHFVEIQAGHYIKLRNGVVGIVRGVDKKHKTIHIVFLWNRGKEEHVYHSISVLAYKRHATVNEVTALKLMGLV